MASTEEYEPFVPTPDLDNASLLTVFGAIAAAYVHLYGPGEVPYSLSFRDYMYIYSMLPHYKDVVIAVEEYMFAREESGR